MTTNRQDVKHVALLATSALLPGSIAIWGIRRLTDAAQAPALRPVRPAGPEAMDTPPEDWDIVDEQSDSSFPASDPPGNY